MLRATPACDCVLCLDTVCVTLYVAFQIDGFLLDAKEPIWRNLAAKRTEVYRDIRGALHRLPLL